MVKKFLCILLVCVMIISVSGCNKGGTPTNSTKSNNPNSIVSEHTKITMSFWEPSTSKEWENGLKAVIEEYNKVQPDVEIELLSQPYTGYTDWIKARFAANDAPDIEENHAAELETQYRNGMLHDIKQAYNSPNPYADNKLWKDIFMEGKLDSAHRNRFEPSYAIPFSGLGIAYYYNKDIYEKLGLQIPKTWDEFLDNCQKIDNANYNPIAMMLMKNDAIEWLSEHIFTSLYANKYLGDPDFNVNYDRSIADQELARAIELGKFDVTKGEDKKAMEKYLDLVEQLSKYTKGASGLDEAGAKAQFLAGKAAHLMSGSWDIKSFIMEPTSNIKIGAFPLPKFTKQYSEYAGDGMTITSVETLGITKSVNDSPSKAKAAEDFMMFLTAPKYYKIFISKSYVLPVVASLDIDPVYSAFNSGSVPSMFIFGKYDMAKSKTSIYNATQIAMSGTKYDREKMLQELQSSAKDFAKSVEEKYQVGKDNGYGVKDLPKSGEFKPTEP